MGKVVEYFELEKDHYETVKERWKKVPLRLHKAELIEPQSEPSIDWGQMGLVTKYRDGLVHGGASIPAGLKGDEGDDPPQPQPSIEGLKRKGQGWALDSVLQVVRQLHEQTDTPVPEYLKDHLESV